MEFLLCSFTFPIESNQDFFFLWDRNELKSRFSSLFEKQAITLKIGSWCCMKMHKRIWKHYLLNFLIFSPENHEDFIFKIDSFCILRMVLFRGNQSNFEDKKYSFIIFHHKETNFAFYYLSELWNNHNYQLLRLPGT